jgi:hypothetical protein
MSGRVLDLPHTLEGALGKGAKARHAKKAGRHNGSHSYVPHLRASLQPVHLNLAVPLASAVRLLLEGSSAPISLFYFIILSGGLRETLRH